MLQLGVCTVQLHMWDRLLLGVYVCCPVSRVYTMLLLQLCAELLLWMLLWIQLRQGTMPLM
jgi:hypothetical protein